MLRRWLTFGLSEEQEDRFRQAHLGADLAQARICILLAVAVAAVFAVNDSGFLGLSWSFYGLQALRLAIIVYALLLVHRFRRLTNYRAYDRAEFVWALAYVTFVITVAATRPHSFVGHAIPVVLTIFIMLLAIPNRFLNQLVITGALLAGETVVLVPDLWAAREAALAALLSTFGATAVAIAVAWNLHSLHRREFVAREEERKATAQAAQQLAERERAEGALRESERRWATTLASIGDAVIATDVTGAVSFLNPAAEDLTGWTHAQAAGRPVTEVFHIINEQTRQEVESPVAKVLREGRVVGLANHTLLVARNGAESTIDDSGAPIRDERGEVAGVVLVFRDVTARRQAEARAAWLASFPQDNPRPVVEVDAAGQLVYANPAARRMLPELEAQGWEHPWLSGLEASDVAAQGEVTREVEVEGAWYQQTASPVGDGHLRIYASDITKRKQAEEARREGRALLEAVVQQMPAGLSVMGRSGEVVLTNRRALETLGRAALPLDLRERDRLTISRHPDGRRYGLEEVPGARSLARGEVITEEEILVTRGDGEEATLLVSSSPLRDETGGITGAVVTFGDVTARKRAEEALRESEGRERERAEELATLLEAVPTPVFIAHDPDGTHITGNRAADELLRNPSGAEASLSAPAGSRPRHFRAVQDGRELSVDELPAQRAARGFRVEDFEFDLVFDDGAVRRVLGYATPLRDGEGQPRGAVHVLVDITERRRVEEALQESEAKYRDLFENMTEEVHFWQLVRDEEGRIKTWRLVDANPPALKTWGQSLDEVQGRTTDEVFGPGATEHYMAVVQKIMAEGLPYSFEDYFPNLDKHFRFTSVPLGEYFITTGADITEIRHAAEELLEAERARVRLAQTLTSEVTHRTKNNLAIVAGLLQLQLERDSAPDPHVDLIRDAVTRIMSFAALHEQMYQRHSGTVELVDALRRIAEVDREALSAGEIEISVEGESADFPASVATNLCVIANELVTNAIKHGSTPGGASRVEIRVSRQGGRLVLSVWNAHNPVAADFDVRRRGKMGLDLVRSIMEEQYGGSFSLFPDRGGTLARVTLDEDRLLRP